MKYLLDTCALSELIKKNPDARFCDWLSSRPTDSLFISVISMAEIWQGVVSLPPGPRKEKISQWFLELKRDFRGQVLPVNFEVAEGYGELQGLALRQGRPIPVLDALIAATALCHRMTLVTRNVRDFKRTGVEVVNPWA